MLIKSLRDASRRVSQGIRIQDVIVFYLKAFKIAIILINRHISE